MAEVEAVLAQRVPLYESLASIILDVDDLDAEGVCNAILARINR